MPAFPPRPRREAPAAALSPHGRAKRQALNAWVELFEQHRALKRAVRALTRRSERAGFNAWAEAARTQSEKAQALSRAVAALSVEGRALRAALNS